jgi:hypothetical protein
LLRRHACGFVPQAKAYATRFQQTGAARSTG